MSQLTLINAGSGYKLRLSNEGKLVLSPKPGGNEPCCCAETCVDGVPNCQNFYSTELEYTYTEDTGNLGAFCSFTYIKGQQTITIPSEVRLPTVVVLTGPVNDDLVVNGKVIQEGKFPVQYFGICNGAHEVKYCFKTDSRTFTLATKDNYGFGMNAKIRIRFCR